MNKTMVRPKCDQGTHLPITVPWLRSQIIPPKYCNSPGRLSFLHFLYSLPRNIFKSSLSYSLFKLVKLNFFDRCHFSDNLSVTVSSNSQYDSFLSSKRIRDPRVVVLDPCLPDHGSGQSKKMRIVSQEGGEPRKKYQVIYIYC